MTSFLRRYSLVLLVALAPSCAEPAKSAPTDTGSSPALASRACGASDAAVPIGFRIDLPSGFKEPPIYGGPTSYDVDGVLTEVSSVAEACAATSAPIPEQCVSGLAYNGGQCPSCTAGVVPAVRFVVRDAAGVSWALTASPQGALDAWTAALQEDAQKPVSLHLRYRTRFQAWIARGFVLSDAAGLVVASNGGHFVDALVNADTPGLTVTAGAPLCNDPADPTCSVVEALSFQSTSSVTVVPGVDGELTIGARTYVVRNGGAKTLGTECGADVELSAPWSIWRKASVTP
jgi:hypothetical protein